MEDVIKLAQELKKESPELRFGQAIYSAASVLYPSQASSLIGSEVDPYYNDDNTKPFLDKLTLLNSKSI